MPISRFETVPNYLLKSVDCIFLCFNLTKRESFTNFEGWIWLDNFKAARPGINMILIGIHRLEDGERVVTQSEVEAFAAKQGINIYLECHLQPEELPQIKDTIDTFLREVYKVKETENKIQVLPQEQIRNQVLPQE